MPFDTLDKVKSRPTYLTELKKEFALLTDNKAGKFWLFEDATLDGGTSDILLLGNVKPEVAAELKKVAKKTVIGTCFREAGTLLITPTVGKPTDKKLKSLFVETRNVGYKVVAPTLSPAGPNAGPEAKVRALASSLESRYLKLEGKVSEEQKKKLTVSFSKITEALGKKEWDTAKRLCVGAEKALLNFAQESDEPEKSRDETLAESRWEAAMSRFDKAKSKLTDSQRLALRELWASADDLREKGDHTGLVTKIAEIERAIVTALKEALESSKSRVKVRTPDLENVMSDDETQKFVGVLQKKAQTLAKVQKVLQAKRTQLEKARYALLNQLTKDREDWEADTALDKGDKPPLSEAAKKAKETFETLQSELEPLRTSVDKQREQHTFLQKKMEGRRLEKGGQLAVLLDQASDQIREIEGLLDDTPISIAKDAISETVGKMSEATTWREGQLKKEAGGDGHATGRHGAQTGFERQARRAATSEEYLDVGKTKVRGGLTPDQPGNVAGTSQTVTWNNVEITYTEEDGKRVIKDRNAVAKGIAGVPSREQASTTGSMWATPVLEKECYDTAFAVATKLKPYTHYAKTSGWGEFKKLVIRMPLPARGPGWGYAVQKTDNTRISDTDAQKFLEKFEKGEITLDALFEELKVELFKVDGGAKMIPHATVVFKRDAVGDDWKLVTQYPNNDLTATDVGWEPYAKCPTSMKFKTSGGLETTFTMTTLP